VTDDSGRIMALIPQNAAPRPCEQQLCQDRLLLRYPMDIGSEKAVHETDVIHEK
jgi:hypothetical protein